MPDTPPGTSTDVIQDPCSVNVGTDVSADALINCDLKGGQVLKFYYEEPDAPALPKENSVNPTLSSPVAAAPGQEQTATAPVASDAIAAPAPAGVSSDATAAANSADHADAGSQTTATTAVAESGSTTAAGELGDIIAASGGGAVGIIAALIAVVGGTAGFKLWTKISEQKHEQSMKKLEIEQANAGLQGAQPPPCQAAHTTLMAEIKGLSGKLAEHEGRIAKAEKASAGFDPTVDVGDLEDRVEALEKTLRKKTRATGGE